MKAKISALVITMLFVCLFFALGITANAATYYTYTVSNDEVTITDCNSGISGDIAVPDTIGGYPVINIGHGAFSGCINLASITIPDSVTLIGDNAFYGCDNLTSVTIGNNVTTIGNRAFYDCYSLASITIPDSVTTIGTHAFMYCESLTSITIPDSVTTIKDYTFYSCINLTSITIPNSVTTIGCYAFERCKNLQKVNILDIESWCNINFDDRYSNPLYYANNLYLNGELLAEITIPGNVTTIGKFAFYDCDSLTSVTIGNSVTTIEYSAFYDCDSLTSITIGNGATTIENYAFYSCNNLASITIPNSVTTIQSYAFEYCNALKDVYYIGNADQWNDISIGYNNYLGTIHYLNMYSFITNGGVAVDSITAEFLERAPVTTRGNLHFGGWYDNAELTGDAITFPYSGEATTLYAKWNVLVEFCGDYNGAQTVEYFKNATLPTPPYGYEYTFTVDGKEWTGESIIDDVTVNVTKNLLKYTVTFIGEVNELEIVEYQSNASLPTPPYGYEYTFTVDGKEWTGKSIKADVTVNVTKSLKKYTITFTGEVNEVQIAEHGSNATLPTPPYGYEYTFTVDGKEWTGESIIDDVTVNVTKSLLKYTVTFIGEVNELEIVEYQSNATLPTPPYGYEYTFTVDGKEWLGENIIADVTVNVRKSLIKYTITFIGEVNELRIVEHGTNATLPIPPFGYIYIFTVNEATWSGKNITSDATVQVIKLCDLANITINNLQNTTTDNYTICGVYYAKGFVPEIEVSENATYKIYSDAECIGELTKISLERGDNTYYIKVTAESGREEIYTLCIKCPIPVDLGTLSVFQTIGGNIIFKTTEKIVGNPEIIVYYGFSQNSLYNVATAMYNSHADTFQIFGLPEQTTYYFKAKAFWGGFDAESSVILETTGKTLSSDCYVLYMKSPAGGDIDHEAGTISNLRVTNKFETIAIDAQVSAGATWELFASKFAATPIKDNVVDLKIYEGRNKNVYLKVTAEDGTQKTYVMSIYRQTKASAPTISVENKKVTITADDENCVIYYTIDGTAPSVTNGIIYSAPFDVAGGTTVKAVVMDSSKDEISDISIANVIKNSTVNIEILELSKNATGNLTYDLYVFSENPITGTLFITLYDKDNKYLGFVNCAELVNINENEYIGSASIDKNALKYKILLWDSVSHLRPVTATICGQFE